MDGEEGKPGRSMNDDGQTNNTNLERGGDWR